MLITDNSMFIMWFFFVNGLFNEEYKRSSVISEVIFLWNLIKINVKEIGVFALL